MSDFLFDKILEGNMAAYSLLYKEYFKRLFNYGFKFCQDRELIEDSIQEVFLDLWQKRERLHTIEAPQAYIFTAFRYCLFKKLKQHAKIVYEEDIPEKAEVSFSQEQIIIQKEQTCEDNEKITAAINTLTSRQHEAIYLRFFENLSYEDVAKVLKISVKATYKIMARSLAAIKSQLPLF